MNIKKSWLFFLPVLILSVSLSLYQVIVIYEGVNKSFFDGGASSVVFVAAIVLLFIVLMLLSAFDKKTAGNYLINKNIPAGVFLSISGVLVVLYGGTLLTNIYSSISINFNFLTVLDIVLSLLSGIAFVYMGFSSLTGKNLLIKSNLLVLFPTLWGTAQIFVIFMGYAAVSVHAVNMLDLVYCVFSTLFILNVSLLYANIKSDNALKSCFVFGMMSIVTVLSYAAASITSELMLTGSLNIINNFKLLAFISLSIYILFFLIELSKNGKTIQEAEEHNASLYDYLNEDGYVIQDEVEEDLEDTLINNDAIINIEENNNVI